MITIRQTCQTLLKGIRNRGNTASATETQEKIILMRIDEQVITQKDLIMSDSVTQQTPNRNKTNEERIYAKQAAKLQGSESPS